MIYITGDTHNTIDMHNASAKQIRLYCKLQNAKYSDITTLIILGDFGLPWFECAVDENGIHPENKEDKYLLNWYNEKPFNILAVQGNHDNYSIFEKGQLGDVSEYKYIDCWDMSYEEAAKKDKWYKKNLKRSKK